MRTLSQAESKAVNGAALTGDQLTYVITLSAQAAVNLGVQACLKLCSTTAPGMLITHVLVPALNISTLAFVTDICNYYFKNPANSASPTSAS